MLREYTIVNDLFDTKQFSYERMACQAYGKDNNQVCNGIIGERQYVGEKAE